MKKLRVFLLAALVLALSAGMAFAAVWQGETNPDPAKRNTWEEAINWDTGIPAPGDPIEFPSGAVVTLSSEATIGDITVSGVNSNVEIMLTAGSILHLDGSTFDVANGATLTFSGSGYVVIDSDITLTPVNQASTINFNTVIAADAIPVIDSMAPRSRIVFAGSVNPSGIDHGTGSGRWPDTIEWHVDNATATLSINDNSQIQSDVTPVEILLSGILEVAGNISTNGNQTTILLLGKGDPSGATGDPTINVLANASFSGAGGTAADTNDLFRALTEADDYRLTKKGPGPLTIAGSASGAGYGLSQFISDVYLYEGDLTLRRGTVAALAPNNSDASRLLTRFYVIDGHLTFANARAVEPRPDIEQATRILLDLSGGTTTMYARSIGSSENVTPAECGDEAYPNLSKAQIVNFPFPTAVNVGNAATLEIKGDQAFQQVRGSGSIVIDEKASLILTDQSLNYNTNPVYFTGSVSGKGSVAFAARTDEVTLLPVASQIYPFTNATYTGDTIVYGKAGTLVLSENSNLGVSALYLRSVKPGKNGGNPSDKVGCLDIVRLSGPSRATRNVSVRRIKLDGATIANNAPVITVGVGANAGPGAEDFTGYMEEGNKFSQVLATGSMTFAANSSEFSTSKYKKVFTLTKRGVGTLFAYGAGTGGTGDDSDDAIAVEEGMLWFYNTAGIGNNQIRVAPEGVLRVANGTVFPSHIKFDNNMARFITEVNDSNLNNGSHAYAVTVSGDVKRGGMSLYGGVDLGDTIFTGEDAPFNYGYGYRTLQQRSVFHDNFDAQTHTQLHGIAGKRYGTHKNTLQDQGVPAAQWFLTGWMETPDTGLKFGSLHSLTAPVLKSAVVEVEEDTFFSFDVDILHSDLKQKQYRRPYVDLLAGNVSSLGAAFEGDKLIRIQGNINKRNAKEGSVDDAVAGIITLHLVPDPNSITRGLPAQRTYVLTYKSGSGGGDEPTPVEPVTSTSTLTVDSATLTVSDDLVLRMAAIDMGVDDNKKINQLKDAGGTLVDVSDVKVVIGNTAITNYTVTMVGGAYQITVPADSVPTGTNAVSLRGTLADGRTIVTPSAGTITKTGSGSGGGGSGGGGSGGGGSGGGGSGGGGSGGGGSGGEPAPTPSDEGGSSSGGCDAGFGALSMAIVAAFFLRKKN